MNEIVIQVFDRSFSHISKAIEIDQRSYRVKSLAEFGHLRHESFNADIAVAARNQHCSRIDLQRAQMIHEKLVYEISSV